MSSPQSARDLKNRVLTCLDKLSDRDTFSSAASDLENIAASLSLSSIPPFLTSLSSLSLSPSSISPVRKLPLRIISLLSLSHGDSLSPHLSRLLSPVLRRLRDPDPSVRLAAAAATAAVSRHVTKPPFSLLLKPFLDSLFTDQDPYAQIGSALCLSAAIEANPDPDFCFLIKLVPRFEKLARLEGFRGKSTLLGVFRSVIGVGPGLGRPVLKILVTFFLECLGSEDWAVRKAAAEAMLKMAVVERESLTEFKVVGLKKIEAKRFDKVKHVRETMNQLLEAWKEIPDITDDISPPMEPISSSKEDASDGRYPPGSKNTYTPSITSVQKKSVPPSITTTGQKKGPLDVNDKRSGHAMFRKLDRKKPADRKIENNTPSTTVTAEHIPKRREVERDENVPSRFAKQETRRALFNQNEYSDATVVVSNVTEDIQRSQKECDDLSLIYKQLGHIETQQSNLLDLLQKFMGSSQNGLRALETRVHGLELTLDEISYDLSLSNKKMPNSDSEGTSCCKLPGAEFLSPKFWKKTEPRHSVSPFSSSRNMTMGTMRERGSTNANADDVFNSENRRFRMQGRNGFIVNPLADLHSDSRGISEVSSK